ncbi:MAG: imidazolonepropionase [Sphingobacteriaceae bacterium]
MNGTLLITEIKSLAGIHADGVKKLRGSEMVRLPILENAWLWVENGRIVSFGPMVELPKNLKHAEHFSARGGYVLPAWCDSHTHLVFAASREEEFVMKIKGQSYEEIAAASGGILNSARKLQETTEDDLFKAAQKRLHELILLGTGAIEIKSGYGLSVADELKMLRVIKRLKESAPIPIKATFLGAHAYPEPYKNNHEAYLNIIIDEMLPQIARQGLADYMDVFCEQGFFSPKETERLLAAGAHYGLKPKVHANQLSASGAVETAVIHQAISVDHLEVMNEQALSALQNSETMATLLPGCSLFLNIPFANARELIGRNVAVALASDFNPGSSPSGNMNLVVSLACMRQKLLPEEAINAATLNGAAAMELADEVGSIAPGKRANLIITKPVPSLAYLPYAFGQNHIEKIIINGRLYE